MEIKNKIGYVDNKYLGIDKPKGHYVFIRKVNKDGTCDVNVITSLEQKISDKTVFTSNKIKYIKKGSTYAIPKKDCNLPRWSGVKKEIKQVTIKNIHNVGRYSIKKKHYLLIEKYLKD